MTIAARTSRWIGWWVLACTLLAPGLAAQTTTAAPAATPAPTDVASALPGVAPPEYQLGSGDVIGIVAYGAPELNRTLVVSSTGELQVSYLPQPLAVSGQTVGQVSVAISRQLRAARILRDPDIDVAVLAAHSHPIVVSGAVHDPKIFYAVRPISLLDAIVNAGGIDANENETTVVLTQPTRSGQSPSVQRWSFSQIVSTPADNPELSGGEEIQVVLGGDVFVTGSVNKPGAFPERSDQSLTVAKVLALAGGLSDSGAPSRTVVAHVGPDGHVDTMIVDANAILKHQRPDIPLLPNDMVYVPDKRLHGTGFVLQSAVQSAFYALGLIAAR